MAYALDPGASRVLLVDWGGKPAVLDAGTGRDAGLRVPTGMSWSRVAAFVGHAPVLLGRDEGRWRIASLAGGLVDTGPAEGVRQMCAAGTRDGSLVALAETDPATPGCRLRLVSLRDGRMVLDIAQPWTAPCALAFSPDATRIACGGVDQPLCVLDVASGATVAEARIHAHDVNAVSFDPTGRLVATGSEDRTVEVRDAATGAPRLRLVGHLAPVRCIAFSPDGRLVVSGASDCTIRLWDARTGTCERILFGHEASVMALGFPDASTLVSVGVDSIRRWCLDDSPVLRYHASADDGNEHPYVYGVAFSPDGSRLASCGWDGTARILDAAARRPLAVLRSPPRLLALAFAPDGRALATAGRDSIELWDTATGERLAELHQGAVHRLAWSPDGRRLAGSSAQGVALHDVPTRGIVFRWAAGGQDCERLAWSRDGSLLAHSDSGGGVVLREAGTGSVARRLSGHARPALAFAFSPDGRTLAAAGDVDVRIWDVATGDERHRLSGHVGRTYALVFTPDGTRLASGGEDATIRIWDTARGEERLVLRGHERYVFDLAFSPDGETLASASGDNTVRLWSTRPGRGAR